MRNHYSVALHLLRGTQRRWLTSRSMANSGQPSHFARVFSLSRSLSLYLLHFYICLNKKEPATRQDGLKNGEPHVPFTHQVESCEICGSNIVFDGGSTATCCKCRMAYQHLYCMRKFSLEVSKGWICEACTSAEGITSSRHGKEEPFRMSWLSREEAFQNSTDIPNRDILNSSSKICNNMTKHDLHKRQRTGKVKFLDTEEVIKLASRSTIEGSPLRTSFRYRSSLLPVSAKLTSLEIGQTSKVNFSSRPGLPPKFPSSTSKPKPRTIPGDLKNPCGGKKLQLTLVADQQASQMTKEKMAPVNPAEDSSSKAPETASLNPEDNGGKTVANNIPWKDNAVCNGNAKKATSNTSGFHGLPTTGSNSCTVTQQKILDAQKEDPLHVLPKLHLYYRYLPALHAIWRGGFKFFGDATPDQCFGGFEAQPPSRVHRKAYEFAQKMPINLQVQLLPHRHALADLFDNDDPEIQDIALYFFSSSIARSKENIRNLFKLLEMQDSVIRSCIAGVELAIFSSKQLHIDSQGFAQDRSCGESFIVRKNIKFRKTRRVLTVPPTQFLHFENSNMDCTESMDMELDILGGKACGRTDVAISKASSRRSRGEPDEESVDV